MTEELTECIPSDSSVEREYESGLLRHTLDGFLRSLTEEKRAIFLRRYFYSQSATQIAVALGIGESKVKVVLHRLRQELRARLEKGGWL